MGIVFEGKPSRLQLSGAFYVYAVEAIDQDVGDSGVFEQWLQRSQTKDLVQNLTGQTFAFGKAQRHGLAVDGVPDQDEHFIPRRIAGRPAQFFQVQAIKDLTVQVGFDLLVFGPFKRL